MSLNLAPFISDPSNPARVEGASNVPSGDLQMAGTVGFIAGTDGLSVFELIEPEPIQLEIGLSITSSHPQLRISGTPGMEIRIERSSDLKEWEVWETITLDDAPLTAEDSDVLPAGKRFTAHRGCQ
jgi:hypothetical protein